MASHAVPLFLTPPAQAIGWALRGADQVTNWHGWMSGADMVWFPSVPRVERARPASDEFGRSGVLD